VGRLSRDDLRWSTFGDPDPDVTRWSHSGVAVLPSGEVVYAEPGGGALLFTAPDGSDQAGGAVVGRLPLPTADAHGITAVGEDLLVADPGTGNGDGQVLRVSPWPNVGRGGVVARVSLPDEITDRWRPTSVAVDASGTMWIADGYGSSLLHAIEPGGAVRTVDGSASGTRFDCPHGVVVDDRGAAPRIVVADRSNRRLVVLDVDGRLDRVIDDPLLTSPSSLAVRGDELLVTDLFGALLAVDAEDTVRALLPIADPDPDGAWPNVDRGGVVVRPEVRDGRLRSPHGIAVGPDGTVFLTEWFLGGRQVRLSAPA
jgi:hypothetical protein